MTLLLLRDIILIYSKYISHWKTTENCTSCLLPQRIRTTITSDVNVALQMWGLGHDWTNLGSDSCMLTLRFLLWILFALYIKPVWNSCCPQEFDAYNSLFIVINLVSSIPFLDNGQVFYVDYGNSARLPLSSLRVLRWGEIRELQFLH